jgi:hypothetical protein
MTTPKHSHWQNDPAILNAARNAPALKPGASGSGVQRLREALREMGAPDIPEPLTLFGGLTTAQLKTFQGLYGLTADGVAGGNTIGKLDELLQLPPARRKPWQLPAPGGDKEQFLQKVASECGPVVREEGEGLPVSAMIACAAVESGWGKGPIYLHTNNLFSLQKWPWVPYPRTLMTMWRPTIVQTNPNKTRLAPFNVAIDMADSARQWCEWILKYGEADGPPGMQVDPAKNPRSVYTGNDGARQRRETLKRMKGDPVLFAKNLYHVSFGESAAKGQLYARVLQENNLKRFD